MQNKSIEQEKLLSLINEISKDIAYDDQAQSYSLHLPALERYISITEQILSDRKQLLQNKISQTISEWQRFKFLANPQ